MKLTGEIISNLNIETLDSYTDMFSFKKLNLNNYIWYNRIEDGVAFVENNARYKDINNEFVVETLWLIKTEYKLRGV